MEDAEPRLADPHGSIPGTDDAVAAGTVLIDF